MALKRGLGRGIDAIFEENGATFPTEKGMVKEIRISDIEPNKEQPRKNFDDEAIASLSESIAANGVLQPIIVKAMDNGRYKIIAGERRWRAAKMAGLKEIPAVISELEDEKIMEVALIENLQREDLNPIEESRGYEVLLKKYNLTQEEIAKRVGKSRPAIANALRLLNLPDEVLDMIEAGDISSGHAKALLACKDKDDMINLAQKVKNEGLSVRQTEKLAKARPKSKAPLSSMFESYVAAEIEKQLGSALERKVKLNAKGKKGYIQIEFYGGEDLETLLSKLGINIEL